MRIFLFLILFSVKLYSQVPIGQWRTHLPYSAGKNVEVTPDKVYCLTEGGLFYYSLKDNSNTILSKINGLSDVTISTIKYISAYNTLIVGYDNGNIDLIQDNNIYNISDIYRKQIIANKRINNVQFLSNGLTYLSCGFGIVLLDIDKKEIKDTYLIGENGTYVCVNDLCTDSTYLYAATNNGIYKALLNEPNLVNFNNWQIDTSLVNHQKKFSNIVYFKSHLIVFCNNDSINSNKIYSEELGNWIQYDTMFKNVRKMAVSEGKLLITCDYFVSSQEDYKGDKFFYSTFDSNFTPSPYDAQYSSDGQIWIADNNLGLVWGFPWYYTYTHTAPNGPSTNIAANIVADKNIVLTTTGGFNSSWNNLFSSPTFNILQNNEWNTLSNVNISGLNGSFDLLEIAIDPTNTNKYFIGSLGCGLFEFENNVLTNKFDQNNSSLQPFHPSYQVVMVTGMTFDEENNLWISNLGTQNYPNMLIVKKANGTWKSFNIYETINSSYISKIVIDKNNTKWVLLPRGKGLLAFNENKTIENTSDDLIKYVSVADENGEIISNEVYSLAVDKDGIIWVGTNKGVPYFYNPENVFDNNNFYAQQVKLPNETPGQANYLLEAETVTSITVDGANQKWFGTGSGGAFLMSSDCTKELLHFTKDNSPILSNSIISITIEPITGEVFFATDKGIISYRATATEPEEYFHDVKVFPNPVRHEYNGTIAISGLVSNCDVKITDITGNVVYQTKSEGGQATWNGRNYSGQKVSTGVYLVFCTNEDGTKKYVTKFLYFN